VFEVIDPQRQHCLDHGLIHRLGAVRREATDTASRD